MKAETKAKRYLFFLAGLFVNSFGVSFVTKANLGTSPISSIPYTLSLGFQKTLGQFGTLGAFTMYFSILLIAIQLLILGKNFPKEYWLQIPVSLVFSYFIDASMNILSFLDPNTYGTKSVSLLLGCAILGVGVFMEVVADVVMLPGESFVKAVSSTFHTEFGKTKVAFDSTMTIFAGVIGFVLYGKLAGVGIGTVVAAILVGMIARFLKRKIGFIEEKMFGEKKAKGEAVPEEGNENKIVITINREYGCGGHEIGERLAKELGFAFVDKEIIEKAAKESNLTEEFVAQTEQKLTNSFIYDLVAQYKAAKDERTPEDKLFEAEKHAIVEAANEGNCVIVGRCADYILKEYKNAYHFFLYADNEVKVQNVIEKEKLGHNTAAKKVLEVNKRRFQHYRYYTGQIFGLANHYSLCLDTGKIGVDKAVSIIREFIK